MHTMFKRFIFAFLFLCLCFVCCPPEVNGADSGALEKLEQADRQVRRFTLDNGMVCLIREDISAPFASIQIWVGTGSIHEQEYLGAGISHAIEHMIFKGTEERKPGEITRIIDDAGGFINAYTTLDRTVFHVDIPSEHWRTGMAVLADAAMNASFPEKEWELERQVILREIAMNRDNPDRELMRRLWENTFMVHPYRHPVIGYEEVFKTITRDDLHAFFRRHYTPDNMIVVVTGDINPSEAEAALRELFSEFTRRARAPVILPREPEQIAPRNARFTGHYEISRLAMAWRTVSIDHPDAPALDMLSMIVGAGRSSRLEQEIKERKQLALSVSAHSFTPREPGLFAITASFEPDKENELVEALLSEIGTWSVNPFSNEDIEKAHRQILSATLSQLQTMSGQARSFASGEFYARDPGFSTTYLRRLGKVTPESVLEAAHVYLRPENRTLVVLAPQSAPVKESEIPPAAIVSDVRKIELRNGMTLLVKEDNRLPFISLCAAFSGGLLLENENNNGLTRLMADMMTRGTRRRSALDIAETVESLGGSLSAFSGNDSFGLRARCLAGDLDIFMDILADCIINPAFSDDELVRQKAEQMASIARQYESPIFLGMQALRELLFPGHPYRFTPEGAGETVESLTRADILALHETTVVSGNMVLAVFGNISEKRVQQLVERNFRKLPRGMRPAPVYEASEPQLPKTVDRRAPREQTVVLAGFPGITNRDPRADAIAVLQNALSGLSSDLMTAIRDERGLAYFAGAFQRAGTEPGMFVIYAGTREDAADEVRDMISAEMARLAVAGLREEEFERARAQIVSAHKQRLQLNDEIALECALNELFGLGYKHGFSIEDRMKDLTREQVKEAAASILKPERKAVSIVLPEGGGRN